MSTPVICIEENAYLVQGKRLAVKNRIRKLSFIYEEGQFVGILTSDDVAKNLKELRKISSNIAINFKARPRG